MENPVVVEVTGPYEEKMSPIISFFSVCTQTMFDEDRKPYAYQAYEDGRLSFFAVTADAFNDQEQSALAERARQEGKEIFLYALPNRMQ